ncbi:MAG: ATP-binding protein [Candidatus Paceibacteria bacterium]
MYIQRELFDKIEQNLSTEKAILIFGPRRAGKTTLLEKFIETFDGEHLLYNGQDIDAQDFLTSQSIEKFKSGLKDYDLLAVDEAQYVSDIGLNLKLIVDNVDIKVIATGSSAFDLGQKVGEPLVGRKYSYKLYPLSQIELNKQEDPVATKSKLEERLVYGSYPEIVTRESRRDKKQELKELVSSYLYKDVLEHEGIKHRKKIVDLLRLLAFQIGNEVSQNELATQLEMSTKTLAKYLDLLEKSYVIKNIRGFSRNLRKEISKTSRYYFYDNGTRNALIDSFNGLELRDDIGQLWENYIVMERLKKQEYTDLSANNYFWRTYDQKEIDWVEERDGKLYGYEIKWSPDKKPQAPSSWIDTYENAEYEVVNKDNYLEFIT